MGFLFLLIPTEIGPGAKVGFTVDLNAHLAFQVGHLGETYEQWVHRPIVSKESPRLFKSDFCEFLKPRIQTVWWAIPIIWLPVVCWSISRSVLMGCTFRQVAVMVASGMLFWTLWEYIIHRFLFHIKTKRETLHIILSMVTIISTQWTGYASSTHLLRRLLHAYRKLFMVNGVY
ncbi:unnamed protein product [Spirodela intermedia]|uniref:Uncharacterized protein n=1 Tax=Spirodela intermedia TaxID=51605 RepID=A0ABN7EB77_SPIIN|nr:unnamed protein product [Spirodela intermedia]